MSIFDLIYLLFLLLQMFIIVNVSIIIDVPIIMFILGMHTSMLTNDILID